VTQRFDLARAHRGLGLNKHQVEDEDDDEGRGRFGCGYAALCSLCLCGEIAVWDRVTFEKRFSEALKLESALVE
jgi:hypothetical protein